MPRRLLAFVSLSTLAGCAAPPLAPLVPVMPGPDKSFAQFRADDDGCRADAQYRVAGQARDANARAVGIGALTTVAGTALGAVVGGGRGAAVGAVTGGGLGIGLGAGSSAGAQGGIQAQYDAAYAQCMYANGNQVPGTTPRGAANQASYEPQPSRPMPYQATPYQAAPYETAPYRSGPATVSRSGGDPLVRDVQRQLRRHGYYPGPTDGLNSPQLAASIQSFQAAHGLPSDGAPSPYLLDALRNTKPGS